MDELTVSTLALRAGLDTAIAVPAVLAVLWFARSFIEKVLWARLNDRAKERLEQLKNQLSIQANVETERLNPASWKRPRGIGWLFASQN